MSARKIDLSDLFISIHVLVNDHALNLPVESVHINKNSIEFFSPTPVELWTEMRLNLQPPGQARPIDCAGVVVNCSGSRSTGYSVSVLFVNLSIKSEEMLHFLTYHL